MLTEIHSHVGSVDDGFAQADAVYEGTYVTQRVQHAHLETHCAIGWLDEAQRLNIRSSTQTPFLTRRALAGIFGLDPARVRVLCERMGGGFGAKQEMLVEDIVTLAVLKTGQPIKLEFTREEQFIGATTRHPMRVRIKAGARRDGRLTAMAMHVLSNTGAYGNHGTAVLNHACGECFAVYNCANKKIDATVVYTNTVPAGAFRGYGLPQSNFAVESAMDELARAIGMDPIEFRERNVVHPGDPMISVVDPDGPHDVEYGSYGLDQCLALVRDAMRRPGGLDPPEADDWLVGEGVALGMIDTVPPGGHIAEASAALRDDGTYQLVVGTAEFGNGTNTVHHQFAATALGATLDAIRVRNADTDNGGHDTGAYGSTGTVVAGRATQLACETLREAIKSFAAEHAGGAPSAWSLVAGAVIRPGHRIALADLAAAARAAGRSLAAAGRWDGTPRSVAFNVQAFRDRREQAHRRDQNPAQRACRRCRDGHQPAAVPRPGRGRRRPVARRRALRRNGDRRNRARDQPDVAQLSSAAVRRRAANRSLLCRYLRCHRPVWRQVDERKPVQSDQRRARQRAGRRHWNPVLPDAVSARSHLSGDRRQVRHCGLTAWARRCRRLITRLCCAGALPWRGVRSPTATIRSPPSW